MLRKEGFIDEARSLGIEHIVYEEPDPVLDDKKYFENFFKAKVHRDVDGVFAITDLFAAKYNRYRQAIWNPHSRGRESYRL